MTLCIAWRRNGSPHITSVLPALVFALLLWSAAFFPGVARAQGGFNGDVQACPADQPCFNEAHQVGDTVVFRFTAIDSWDFYNVRYVDGGGNVKQVENKSGHYTFTNVEPGRVYRISVQGCTSHTLAHSTCSPWSEASVTTAGGTGSVSQPVVGQRAPSEPGKSLGRVGGSSGSTGPPMSLCERARDARARNSPAAPDLEAQCRAHPEPVKSLGRVAGSSGSTGPPMTLCEHARDARARNSPAAPNLEAQCRANPDPPTPVATAPDPPTPVASAPDPQPSGRAPIPANDPSQSVPLPQRRPARAPVGEIATPNAANALPKLSVSSTPEGADIELDGDFVGNTPSELSVTEGNHTIRVKKTGFTTWERILKTSAGSTVRISAELEAAAN